MSNYLRAGLLAVVAGVAGMALADENYAKEDQSPTGKFLTATEVRPILEATRANWIAVREYNGLDLLYFTHLLSWRCGLHEVRFALNGGESMVFDLPPCDAEGPSPAAIPEDAVIYLNYPLGSIETVEVELLYDDLGTAEAVFERKAVLIP
ncbi:hypothetical protein [Shimia aestuarii]|uniref:hypothetical protein n=1 Tax=Shimia aestuarii TaxID=254406 RepID=UPI001FB48905|nr:hypothetical protein [Shimia aestuarii]